MFLWQLETQIFASPYIYLAYIFEASYSMLLTSELKKLVVLDCQRNCMEDGVRLSEKLYEMTVPNKFLTHPKN